MYSFALEKKEIQRIKFPVNVIKLQKMTFNQEDIKEPIEIELKMNKNAIIDVRRVL